MPAPEQYACDADALVNLDRHYPQTWRNPFRKLARAGNVKIPEGVFREIMRQDDRLKRFVERLEPHAVVKLNEKLKQDLVRIESLYGHTIRVGGRDYAGFWSSAAGKKAVDGQVIVIAKTLILTAVSDDHAVKLACSLEDVPCIGWAEFARRLELAKLTAQVKQIGLFEPP